MMHVILADKDVRDNLLWERVSWLHQKRIFWPVLFISSWYSVVQIVSDTMDSLSSPTHPYEVQDSCIRSYINGQTFLLGRIEMFIHDFSAPDQPNYQNVAYNFVGNFRLENSGVRSYSRPKWPRGPRGEIKKTSIATMYYLPYQLTQHTRRDQRLWREWNASLLQIHLREYHRWGRNKREQLIPYCIWSPAWTSYQTARVWRSHLCKDNEYGNIKSHLSYKKSK